MHYNKLDNFLISSDEVHYVLRVPYLPTYCILETSRIPVHAASLRFIQELILKSS
jgi:hypothetical protein